MSAELYLQKNSNNARSQSRIKVTDLILRMNNEKKIENTIARHPLKKIGDVNDIVNMVSFLIDDKSQWITGQTLKVDGGISNLKI